MRLAQHLTLVSLGILLCVEAAVAQAPPRELLAPEQPSPDQLSPELPVPEESSTEPSEPEPKPELEPEVADEASQLLDTEPNLLRPEQADEVTITTNQAISLDAAIATAIENNPTIRIRQLQIEQSQAAVIEAEAAYAPNFSVNGNFDQSGSISDSNELYRDPDLNQSGDSNSRDATIGLSGNARIDYSILDPARRARVRAAELNADRARLALEQEAAQLRLDVSESYYNLQESDEQVVISQQAVRSAQRSLEDAIALRTAGVGTRFAQLQAEVQLANEQQNLVNSLSRQQQARRQLAQILSTPEQLNLTAADPVQPNQTWQLTLEASIVEAYANRVELDDSLIQRQVSEAQRTIALARNRPSLSAFAQAGPGVNWRFNRTDPDGGDDQTSGIRNASLGYQAGLSFQWRFGDGGAAKAAARQQELNGAIADETFESTRDQVRREVEDAFYNLAANLRNIDTAEKGVTQAEEALRLARLRFQSGVGTQSEVIDSERDLTTALGNRVTAILDYNRARVQIERAVGRIAANIS